MKFPVPYIDHFTFNFKYFWHFHCLSTLLPHFYDRFLFKNDDLLDTKNLVLFMYCFPSVWNESQSLDIVNKFGHDFVDNFRRVYITSFGPHNAPMTRKVPTCDPNVRIFETTIYLFWQISKKISGLHQHSAASRASQEFWPNSSL